MRWRPEGETCPECGFSWSIARADALGVVGEGPEKADALFERLARPSAMAGERWSPAMYLWHLVDVVRIGRERLLTLELDPQAGIPCWDENALAAARRYEALSWRVGVAELRDETARWLAVARAADPAARVEHPQFGRIGAHEITVRVAHEVHHHLADMTAPGEV